MPIEEHFCPSVNDDNNTGNNSNNNDNKNDYWEMLIAEVLKKKHYGIQDYLINLEDLQK